MRRLYLQVYLAFLAVLLVFGVLVATAWHHGFLAEQDQDTLDGAAAAGRGPAAARCAGRRSSSGPWARSRRPFA